MTATGYPFLVGRTFAVLQNIRELPGWLAAQAAEKSIR